MHALFGGVVHRQVRQIGQIEFGHEAAAIRERVQVDLAPALVAERLARRERVEEVLVEIREHVACPVDRRQAEEFTQLRHQMLDERGARRLGSSIAERFFEGILLTLPAEVGLQLDVGRHLENAVALGAHLHDARRRFGPALGEVPVERIAVLVDDEAPARAERALGELAVELRRQVVGRPGACRR
jgi:hypothetical protein